MKLDQLKPAKENEELWPVYKGDSFDIWENDTKKPYAYTDPPTIKEHLFEKRKNSKSIFENESQTWINDPTTLSCLFPRIVFRDTTGATASRTLKACLVAPKTILTHLAPYIFWNIENKENEAYLLGILSSIPLDWYVRRIVGQHITFYLLNSFPIPNPNLNSPLRRRVIEIAGRLAATDERFNDWAKNVGVKVASVKSDEEKFDLIFELDAVVAHLYKLDKNELIHIFETFNNGKPYRPPKKQPEPEGRMEAVLEHYQVWSKKIKSN